MKWFKILWFRLKFLFGIFLKMVALIDNNGNSVKIDLKKIAYVNFDENTKCVVIVEEGKNPQYFPVIHSDNMEFAKNWFLHKISKMEKSKPLKNKKEVIKPEGKFINSLKSE